jgi:polyisoprenoid-binding protein YceI
VTVSLILHWAWSATVPVNVADATYKIDVAHSLYLTNQKPLVTVTNGGSFAQGTTTLKGGDANNSGTVEIGDLACIGSDFGTANNSCAGGNSDINADNTVNILDLVLLAATMTNPHLSHGNVRLMG